MKVPSVIRFIDAKARKRFYKLKSGGTKEIELFRIINLALDHIEENAFWGIQIPKRLIPRSYIVRYDIKNLWKYNLPKGRRLLYSIVSNDNSVICLVIEWLDHKQYNRRFNY